MDRREAIAALMALPATTRVSKAVVQPTDTIVLEVPGVLTVKARERLRAQLQNVWPGNKVAVLDGGMRLKIAENL